MTNDRPVDVSTIHRIIVSNIEDRVFIWWEGSAILHLVQSGTNGPDIDVRTNADGALTEERAVEMARDWAEQL